MKNCELCKHYEHKTTDYPCKYCYSKNNKPHWEPGEEMAELIEAAERKAFRGGMNYGRPKECGTSEEHANSAFNFWKEESK